LKRSEACKKKHIQKIGLLYREYNSKINIWGSKCAKAEHRESRLKLRSWEIKDLLRSLKNKVGILDREIGKYGQECGGVDSSDSRGSYCESRAQKSGKYCGRCQDREDQFNAKNC
jgi:hypothetical protein